MTRETLHQRLTSASLLVLAVLAIGLTRLHSYLLFHTLAELFSVVIAACVFIVAWNGRRYATAPYLLVIGSGYFWVALLDLLHAIAYQGMGVFASPDANLATQIWIAARLTEAGTLATAPLWRPRRAGGLDIFVAMGIAPAIMGGAIAAGVFPDCFVPGRGLTPFKIAAEYVVIAALLAAIAGLRRLSIDDAVRRTLVQALAVSIASELAFTLYSDVYGAFNMAGHLLKIVSFALVYAAVVRTGIVHPFAIIFHELVQTQQRLQNAVADLDAFAGSVSHDLRAPVRRTHEFAALLLADPALEAKSETRVLLERIHANGRRADEMMQELLRLARLGRTGLELKRCNLGELAREVESELRDREPDRAVDLAITGELDVVGDRKLLRLALQNLIGNAWKFTSREERARIELGAGSTFAGMREFFVRDNGAGFDPRAAERLFRPFSRLHNEKDFEGSGLGLASVRRIIEAHGGTIRAEGDVGRGATFFFTLPAPSGQPPIEPSTPLRRA